MCQFPWSIAGFPGCVMLMDAWKKDGFRHDLNLSYNLLAMILVLSFQYVQCQSTSALVLSFQYVQCQSTSAFVPKTQFKFRAIVMLWEFPSTMHVITNAIPGLLSRITYLTMINGESHYIFRLHSVLPARTARGQLFRCYFADICWYCDRVFLNI
jgi:hypothetical protein